MRYFLCLLLCPLFGQSQDELVRAPHDLLDGNRLIEKVWRYTISAPEGWSWYTYPDDKNTYVAITPWSDGKVTVDLDYTKVAKKPLKEEMDSIIRKLERFHTDKGFLITQQGHQLKDGPFPMALVVLKGQNEMGDPIYIHYFVIRAGDLYRVHSITDSQETPAYLVEMILSFRLLGADGEPLPLENARVNNSSATKIPIAKPTPGSSKPAPRSSQSAPGSSEPARARTPVQDAMLLPAFILFWGFIHLICWVVRKMGWEWNADRITQVIVITRSVLLMGVIMARDLSKIDVELITVVLLQGLFFYFLVHLKIRADAKKAMNAGPPPKVETGSVAERAHLEDQKGALAIFREAGASDPSAWPDYLKLAIEAGSAEDTNNAARLLIGQAIKEEDAKAALTHWNQVTQQAPGVSLPHTLANSVASLLHTQWQDAEADQLLTSYLTGLTHIKPSALLSSTELLGKKQPQLALTWLERLRNAHNLSAREEQHRDELNQRFAAAAAVPLATTQPPPVAAPVPPPVAPISPVSPAARQLVIHVAIPSAIEEKGLRLSFPGNAVKLLPYGSIKALAAAVIHEGGKPFLLIDLVLSDLSTEQDVRLLRMDSRQYSAHKILPQSANASAAFKQLASLLLQGSGAKALPSADAVIGAPYLSHKTIKAYEQAIYN